MLPPMSEASLHEIAQRYGARLLLRFGSTLRGGTHQRSDVDVGVLFGNGVPDFERLAELEADLQAAFPERPIDLAVLDRADPLFLAKVLERCELLAGEPRRLAELRGYAFRRYVDHKRFLAMEADYVARRLGRPVSR